MLLHPLRSELNFPIGAKFDLDVAPLRWHFPMFLLTVLLCADRFASGRGGGRGGVVDDDEMKKSVPLAAESSRLRDAIVKLVTVLERGYAAKALQQVHSHTTPPMHLHIPFS